MSNAALCVELHISGALCRLYWHLFPKVTLIQLRCVSRKCQPLRGKRREETSCFDFQWDTQSSEVCLTFKSRFGTLLSIKLFSSFPVR